MHIVDFVARTAEDGAPLLGTTVDIKAQDGRTFCIGSNINDGGGVGQLGGTGFNEVDGIVSVSHYTGKRATPTLPLGRLYTDGVPNAGEMGIRVVDGPGGPASRLELTLPFV